MSEVVPQKFLENLLELIALGVPVDGDIHLKRNPLGALIQSSQQHTGFLPFFSDDEMAFIVKESRIDWKSCFVSSQDTSDTFSLLSHLINNMEMNEYLTWLPSTAKALNDRYTPHEQVVMLRKCEAMPGGNGSMVDGRHLLAGRIVPLILQSEEHLDAWVDSWFHGIKSMEGKVSFLDSFSNVNTVTKKYKALPDTEGWLCRTPILMALAGALDHESVMRSVSRYTPASLYDICSGDFTGYFSMCGKDFARRNLSYGMFLHHGAAAQALSSSFLSGVIRDRHFELSSTILAVSVNFDDHSLPIDELIGFEDKHTGCNALDNMLQDHAFSWVGDWFERLNANANCAHLRSKVLSAERFETWCKLHAGRNRNLNMHGRMSTLKKLKLWVSLFSSEDKRRCLEFALNKFKIDIQSTSKYSQGIFFAKILISVFPDNERARHIVQELIGAVIRKSLASKDKEIVTELLKQGLVSLAEIGRKISSTEAFALLTGPGGIDRDDLLPHLKHTLKGKIFSDDLGV